jgi:hypothetical protein
MIPYSLGVFLGHNLSAGELQRSSGIGGASDCYKHSNKIVVFGQTIDCDCHISKTFDMGVGLLGQNGFFSRYTVVFDYRNNFFEVYE